MGIFDDFAETIETDDFKEFQENKRRENEKRLHCDLSTRRGKTIELLDDLDNLGFVIHTNAKRDEEGRLLYDDNGEVILLEGETEAKIIDRIGFLKRIRKMTE